MSLNRYENECLKQIRERENEKNNEDEDDDHDDNETVLELNKLKQSIVLRGKLCFKCNVKFDAEERLQKTLLD